MLLYISLSCSRVCVHLCFMPMVLLCKIWSVERFVPVDDQGYMSGPDYAGKKTMFILFINGRPVDCPPLKRALEAGYASVLPASSKPFIFFVSGSRTLLPAIQAIPFLTLSLTTH